MHLKPFYHARRRIFRVFRLKTLIKWLLFDSKFIFDPRKGHNPYGIYIVVFKKATELINFA